MTLVVTALCFVTLFVVCYGKANDYVICLSHANSSEDDHFLDAHIQEVSVILKGNFVKHVYRNLAELRFYAYAITLQQEHLAILEKLENIKFIEQVGNMSTADSYFTNRLYTRSEDSVLEGHEGFCTLDYDLYHTYLSAPTQDTLPAIVSNRKGPYHRLHY